MSRLMTRMQDGFEQLRRVQVDPYAPYAPASSHAPAGAGAGAGAGSGRPKEGKFGGGAALSVATCASGAHPPIACVPVSTATGAAASLNELWDTLNDDPNAQGGKASTREGKRGHD